VNENDVKTEQLPVLADPLECNLTFVNNLFEFQEAHMQTCVAGAGSERIYLSDLSGERGVECADLILQRNRCRCGSPWDVEKNRVALKVAEAKRRLRDMDEGFQQPANDLPRVRRRDSRLAHELSVTADISYEKERTTAHRLSGRSEVTDSEAENQERQGVHASGRITF
jgi:hypothetical protein